MNLQSINPHGVPFAEDALTEADVIAAPCVDASIDSEARFVELEEQNENHSVRPLASISSNNQG